MMKFLKITWERKTTFQIHKGNKKVFSGSSSCDTLSKPASTIPNYPRQKIFIRGEIIVPSICADGTKNYRYLNHVSDLYIVIVHRMDTHGVSATKNSSANGLNSGTEGALQSPLSCRWVCYCYTRETQKMQN